MPNWKVGQVYLATGTRAVDGDTLDVAWSPGGAAAGMPTRIRIARIDAPELRPHPEPGALAAQAALGRLAQFQELEIIPRRSWPDPYGRLIADIRVDNHDVAQTLIQWGFVVRYSAYNRRQARIRQKGLNPVSAIPTRRLNTPPRTITGLPISNPSIRTGSSTEIGTQPHQT